MNKVILIGRTTADIDLRMTGNGTPVAKFTLAVDRRNKDDGTDFIYCTAWSKTAEVMDKYVKKGDRIGIVGRLQVSSYEKDGQKRYATEVTVESLEFLTNKPKDGESAKASSEGEDWQNVPDQVEDAQLPF